MANRSGPPKARDDSVFDVIPPILAQNMTGKDYVKALKESRWNNDYQAESFKSFLQADSIDDIVFADYKCSIANSLVLRYILPEYIQSKGLNIDRIMGVESDGEYAPSFSSIEIAPDEKVSRLIYGNYFASNETVKYVIHLEEGYQDDYKFKIASRKDATPDANAFLEEFKKYGEEHNFLKGKKIDPACNFIKFDRKYDWSDLILPEKIKDDIRTNLINLIESREIYRKNGLQVKRGLILSGAPGTGKSMLAKVLCNQVDWTLVWVSPKHLEQGARKIASIVQLCKDLSPTIMLLEDIDLYGNDRASNHNPALLGEMMNQLDGVQENTDIITIATTNNKDVLEKALLDRPGRFDKVIDFPLPDENDRLQMLKVFSNGLVNESLPFLGQVAKDSSKNMTGAQVRELVNMAIITAIDEKAYDGNQKLLLNESHFHKAVKAVKGKDFTKAVGFYPTGASSLLPDTVNETCPDLDDL
jgi:cell division protease FtsH